MLLRQGAQFARLEHVRWRPREQHPQSRDCARRLSSGGERRGEEAAFLLSDRSAVPDRLRVVLKYRAGRGGEELRDIEPSSGRSYSAKPEVPAGAEGPRTVGHWGRLAGGLRRGPPERRHA